MFDAMMADYWVQRDALDALADEFDLPDLPIEITHPRLVASLRDRP